MKTQYCIICNRAIGILGWPKHVNMHKRELGKDIYVRCKRIDANIRKVFQPLYLHQDIAQKSLKEFMNTSHKKADAERRSTFFKP